MSAGRGAKIVLAAGTIERLTLAAGRCGGCAMRGLATADRYLRSKLAEILQKIAAKSFFGRAFSGTTTAKSWCQDPMVREEQPCKE